MFTQSSYFYLSVVPSPLHVIQTGFNTSQSVSFSWLTLIKHKFKDLLIRASLNTALAALNVQPALLLLMQRWCLATERMYWAAFHWYLLQAQLCKNWTGCSTYRIHQADIMGAIITSWMCKKRRTYCCFKAHLKRELQQGLTHTHMKQQQCFKIVLWMPWMARRKRLTNIRQSQSYMKAWSADKKWFIWFVMELDVCVSLQSQ